jgi:cytochrome c-type biogenesis protein CcmF
MPIKISRESNQSMNPTPVIHSTIGNIGHLSVIVAFIASMASAYTYLQATLTKDLSIKSLLQRYARYAFYLHSLSVIGIIVSMFAIIYNHYFEYHYAWSHSSKALPIYYMISCFWEGQEGSFLLWTFWHVVLGLILIRQLSRQDKATDAPVWEAPVMAIFAAVQAFLSSMILGVVFFETLKIGSSPFLTLKEAMPDLPVWQMQPNFVPEDGNGLNPLLQNYWMVIHPPTLFLGFATTLVPFAFCIAGLWQGRFKEWVKPALPWALFSAMVLGVGILMGAYWAYETLTFGGYWNWDPVENAIYVPWVVMIAAIHTLIIYNTNKTALRTSIILIITQFILILYSTFLTRSGILGNASVHSFTDLGLSGQLLLYMFFFLAVSIAIVTKVWKRIPADERELGLYNREFWLFSGTTVLCLASFQVIVTTSIPVYNKIVEAFGFVSKLALPTDQIGHYTKFQLWFFVCIAILSGIGQYVWWRKTDSKKGESPRAFFESFANSLIITFITTAIVIILTNVHNWIYIASLVASIFSIVTNGRIIIHLLTSGKFKISGGAITHLGVAIMLVGILYSAGYSKVVSLNNTGLLISNAESFTANNNEGNKENVMLWLNKPARMNDYLLTYKGQRIEVRDMPHYVKREEVEVLTKDFHAVALNDLVYESKTYHKKGDTLEVFPENTFYEVEYREPNGRVFTLYPKAQVNPKMGLLASPDIYRKWSADLYTHVSYVNDPNGETEWSKTEEKIVSVRDTFFVNDYVAILDDVALDPSQTNQETGETAVKASIRILEKDQESKIEPIYLLNTKTGMVQRKPVENMGVGLKIRFENIDPKAGRFTFGIQTTQKDFIVMKALEKPFINILWIGSLVVTLGFIVAMVRRFKEVK